MSTMSSLLTSGQNSPRVRVSGQPLNRTFSFLFPNGGPTAAMLKRSMKSAAEKDESNKRRGKCGRCQHGSHVGGLCNVCGVKPCHDRCPRCLCARHTGQVCPSCMGSLKDKRFKCVSKCLLCEHPEDTKVHSEEGCTDCEVGIGCNSLASLAANSADPFGNLVPHEGSHTWRR